MNIGEKIQLLFKRSGYKNYADWGRAMGLPGDWLNELKKKVTIKIIDIERIIKIANYNQVSIDWLLKDHNDDNYIIDNRNDLADNDIINMLNQIQNQLKNEDVKFNGYVMNEESKQLTCDAIDILKGLVRNNL
jgi:hypothetical protein